MKNSMFFLFAIVLLAVEGCYNNNDFVVKYKCEANGNGDWINCHTLGNYGGVNGEYCSRVDSTHEFSLGFRKLLSEVSPERIRKISVSVSVKLMDLGRSSSLVVQVSNAKNENVFWSSHELPPMVEDADKWCSIEVTDILPEYEREGAKASIYIWNPYKTTVYVDNMEVKFLLK